MIFSAYELRFCCASEEQYLDYYEGSVKSALSSARHLCGNTKLTFGTFNLLVKYCFQLTGFLRDILFKSLKCF